jgi:integrase/recombinase XerD
MQDPSRVRVAGPLAPFATGFLDHLRAQGYRFGAFEQLSLVAHLSRWMAQSQLDVGSLAAPLVIDRFVVVRRRGGYSRHVSARALRPLLAYLRGLGHLLPEPAMQPADPVEVLLERWRRYLLAERSLGAASASTYLREVRPFLYAQLTVRGLDLSGLDAGDLRAFVLSRPNRGCARNAISPLRSLLGFLHLDGVIEKPLKFAVPAVARWRLASLPEGLAPAHVQHLLASCVRRTTAGRRDYAILALLIRLGLRSCEVARLRLDDIDWHAGEIVVNGKGARAERLPLPADVGEAIAAYLRGGRPGTAQGRSVFISINGPHQALAPSTVGEIVSRAARRAGLDGVNAHRLRHTAASEMLRGGASLPEIGQVLRHRRMQTTAIYAKVDYQALRELARPWPGGLA